MCGIEDKVKNGSNTKYFNSLAFPKSRDSPQLVVGMDKLMEATDNQINEARAYVRKQEEKTVEPQRVREVEDSVLDTVEDLLILLQKMRKQGIVILQLHFSIF